MLPSGLVPEAGGDAVAAGDWLSEVCSELAGQAAFGRPLLPRCFCLVLGPADAAGLLPLLRVLWLGGAEAGLGLLPGPLPAVSPSDSSGSSGPGCLLPTGAAADVAAAVLLDLRG